MQRLNPRTWQISIFALILIALACNVSAPPMPFLAPTPTPTATPIPLPPALVETVPQSGSEIPLQAPLTVFFSEKMDRATVESALTSDFSGGFNFTWADDSILAITPKSALPPNGQVTFTLAVTAKSAAGLALLEPLTFSYQTAGALRVTQVLPASQAVDVSPDSAVVVAFNQPVVPLGADAATLPAGLTLEPAAQGQGEWLNTSTYVFRPEPALSGGAEYVARVNPRLMGLNGSSLDADSQGTAWAFKTSLPKLLNVSPSSEVGWLELTPTFKLTFNQSMDRASLESGFSLSSPNGKVAGKFEWNEKSTEFRFTPSSQLERDARYLLSLSGLARSRGGATLGNDVGINYQSVPQFGVWQTSFPNGETRPGDKDIKITFTCPLGKYELGELEKMVTVSPEPAYFNPNFSKQSVNIYGGFAPGQLYTLTFPASLQDKWGQTLGQDYTFTFREPDAQPSLSFSSFNDTIFIRPDQPVVNVQAVNTYSLDISRADFPLDDFLRYDTNFDFRDTYSPANPKSWSLTPNLPRNDNQPVAISISDASLIPITLICFLPRRKKCPNPLFPSALPSSKTSPMKNGMTGAGS